MRMKRAALTIAGALAAFVLSACSATHVGESWQCPLAQGSSCTSIADADPAVPASAARPAVLFGETLPGARRQVGGAATGGWYEPDEACNDGCGLLAWLKGLFAADADAPRPAPEPPATASATDLSSGQDGKGQSAPPVAAKAADEDLRVPEVLGRIWIAPFVDADGIYREAHWVRVVLQPAGWKLP